MNEQKMLDGLVREWETEGRCVDRGRWTRAKNGTLEYLPTKREIAAKCKLFRAIGGWRGAAKRAPRGGEFSVATTAGISRPRLATSSPTRPHIAAPSYGRTACPPAAKTPRRATRPRRRGCWLDARGGPR